MIIFRKLILFIANNLLYFLLSYLFLIFSFFYFFNQIEFIQIENLLIFIFISFLSFEIIFRILLCLCFGSNYRSIIDSNFITNHKEYGYSLKPNKSSSNEYKNSFLFDKFIFAEKYSNSLLSLIENKKNRIDFNTNSLGFRGREFSKKKSDENKIRIFCTGGSTTAGSSDDEKTWPKLLEKKLIGMNFNVEVINAGVYGWHSAQELIRFKNEIINYDIDILLIHQGWNEEFNYSSLNLGQDWSPGLIRGLIESNVLYLLRAPFLSKIKLFTLFFILKNFYSHRRLSTMSFFSHKRWEVLKQRDYLLSWFDNLIEFAKLSKKRNILCYTIDYPTLVDNEYTKKDLKFIRSRIKRLNNEFINYQSISKIRITNFLKKFDNIISLIDTKKIFSEMKVEDKIKYFHDEMHTNEYGNEIIADQISINLKNDKFFLDRNKNISQESNILDHVLEDKFIDKIRKKVSNNPQHINRYLDRKIIEMKKNSNLTENNYLPSNRYTTF